MRRVETVCPVHKFALWKLAREALRHWIQAHLFKIQDSQRVQRPFDGSIQNLTGGRVDACREYLYDRLASCLSVLEVVQHQLSALGQGLYLQSGAGDDLRVPSDPTKRRVRS